MFCVNCGSKIDGGMKFCTKCGAPIYEKSLDIHDTASSDDNTNSQDKFNNIWNKIKEFFEAVDNGYWAFGAILIIVTIILSIFF